MSDLADRARSIARSAPLTADDSVRAVARALQDPLVATLGPVVGERLTVVDRRFAARVAAWESGSEEPDRRARLVTPWPDVLGFLATAWAMGSALGIGRLTGGTPLNSLPVVAPTVIASYGVAFLLFAFGVVFVRRERQALLAEYEDSRAVTRETVVATSAVFAVICLIAMIVRLVTDDVFPAAIAATAVSAVGVVVTVVLTFGARRLAAASAAGGRFIHRPRATTRARQRNEAISASEDARDDAASALDSAPETRDAIADAYASAVTEIAARKILTPHALRRLSPDDWLAARYAVDV